jgi:lysyl-tRNA synthetase class 2
MLWQPSATVEVLKKRAKILRTMRDFFYARHVTEVETPLLCVGGTTDVYLDSMAVTLNGITRYLQTSPEYAMKRLLAAGIGDCYQICKAFRCDESGRNHNPEFTMLEWYRLSFDHHQLMNDFKMQTCTAY